MAKSKRAVTTKLRSEHISLQQNVQNAYQHSINRSVANYQKNTFTTAVQTLTANA